MLSIRFTLAAALTTLLVACGGGGDNGGGPSHSGGGSSSSGGASSSGGGSGGLPPPASAPPLKTTLATRFAVVNFPVGAAIEPASTTNTDAAILQKHFSSITAENAMKPNTVWPNAPGSSTLPAPQPNFAPGDALATFAFNNGMQLRAHTLLWHHSAPSWLFAGDRSMPANYRAGVQQHLRDYIFAVVQHFPNVYAWDVVNEVASDTPNDPNPYRTDGAWYDAYSVGGLRGADYVRDAFNFAFQARQSIGRTSADMKLMINDYNTELPGKRANLIAVIRDLQSQGVVVEGVGHQFHLQLDADVSQVTAALTAVEALPGNLVNHVTELDVSIYKDPGSCYSAPAIPPCMPDYGANPPDSVLSEQAVLYRALFNAFNRPSVTSITTWGIGDNHTWLNSFPVARTNRPLLFDTVVNPKAAFWAVVDPQFVIP